MKLALYQPWIYLHGGLERSILELVTRSRHDWTIFTGHYDPDGTFPGFKDLDVRVVGKTSIKRNIAGVLQSVADTVRLKLPVDPSTDAIVVWCDGVGDMVTFRNHELPLYNICSTPLRAAFDPVYSKLVMRNLSLPQRLVYRGFQSAFRFVDRMAWRHYDGIVATSSEVKTRIVYGGLCDDGPRMTMAYPGVEWSEQPPDVVYEPFMLLPGRIMWTKNIQQAIRGFLFDPPPQPWRLVIAGYVDKKSQSYLAELRELAGGNARIEFVVSPTDEELFDLYRRAAFCLFTPLNEDWGIVPLEAMARAKAVIATARGGPRESMLEEQTGMLLEPDDDAGWSQAIRRLAMDPVLVRQMGQRAHAHVGRFSWAQFQTRVDDALERWTFGRSAASGGRPHGKPQLQPQTQPQLQPQMQLQMQMNRPIQTTVR